MDLGVQGFVDLLKGSWDLVTRVIIRVTILITPIKVVITLLPKSHDPPSRVEGFREKGLGSKVAASGLHIGWLDVGVSEN